MSAQPTSELNSTHIRLVEVSLEATDEAGESQTTAFEIPAGDTAVPKLKEELGLEATAPLWVIKKDGKRKPLSDHEHHDVKEGDRYQAIVKGHIS
jgi:sulfur carrier protein ThiS